MNKITITLTQDQFYVLTDALSKYIYTERDEIARAFRIRLLDKILAQAKNSIK